MNREDIIRMAREAEIVTTNYPSSTIERYTALVVAAEREACAKVLDEMAEKDKLSNYYRVAAIAIRARGQQ